MRLTDAHAHLNGNELAHFRETLEFLDFLRVISNSVDLESSEDNIRFAKKCSRLVPFVGIHPEIFGRPENAKLPRGALDDMVDGLGRLLKDAKGIGEIGLDPKYDQEENQMHLLRGILSHAESHTIPITFHCRETTSQIIEVLSSYRLHQPILFHWFSGSESELKRLHERGFYTSFGPSILFSRRLRELVLASDRRLILAETDSPTSFQSLFNGPSTPFMIPSVAFKMSQILDISLKDVCELTDSNATKYLLTQD
ncbi:MAG: TatD family hydrolase [Nitrososphaerota archaeon]|nr:TatD family hydrolase [Nitrososphaerota archaeon]